MIPRNSLSVGDKSVRLWSGCETTTPSPPTLSQSSNHFFFLAGRWSTSGWGGNAHFFTYTRIRSRETGENRRINEQTRTKLGVTKSRKEVLQHYMHVRTIASVGYLRKFHNATGIRHLETLLHWTLSCLLASLFPCLVLTAPPFFHANFSSAACLSALQPPTASLGLLPPTASLGLLPPTLNCVYWVASSTLIRLPVPLPGTARFHVQESFVWFRAKTDNWIVCFGSLPP